MIGMLEVYRLRYLTVLLSCNVILDEETDRVA